LLAFVCLPLGQHGRDDLADLREPPTLLRISANKNNGTSYGAMWMRL
jgi:hypothetical protein